MGQIEGEVGEIMMGFAEETGLISDRPPRRYLWTDAFAVCNFLELYAQTGDHRYRDLAVQLVHQVHEVLGRHRDDDPRTGWLSGLSGDEAARHPTLGGLRIGKRLPERPAGEPLDEDLEWDRDGQYYHYLTKWLHALNRVGQFTGEPDFVRWAFELAKTMHVRFTHQDPRGGRPYLVWKMSVDLTRPLVSSTGQHDALDGLITCTVLQTTASAVPAWADLEGEIADLARMCEGGRWATVDPLGAGGVLVDTYRVGQLMARDRPLARLFETLLADAVSSVTAARATKLLTLPPHHRLAFRELGLAIGLRAVPRLHALVEASSSMASWSPAVADLRRHEVLADEIVAFWRSPPNQRPESWTEHADINRVMLATSLAPDVFLRNR